MMTCRGCELHVGLCGCRTKLHLPRDKIFAPAAVGEQRLSDTSLIAAQTAGRLAI